MVSWFLYWGGVEYTNVCNWIAPHQLIDISHYFENLLPKQQNTIISLLLIWFFYGWTKLEAFILWLWPKEILRG